MRITPAALVASAVFAVPTVLAQPAAFFDLDTIVAPVTPPSASEPYDTSGAFGFSGETLGVQWFRFSLAAPIAGDLYLDVSADIFEPERDLALALYDATGALVASDDSTNGRFGLGAGLSFGSTAERTPPDNPRLLGQNGATLAAGEYWLALAAGTGTDLTFGATDWNVTTTASFPLGFGEGESYIEVYVYAGNTTPPPAPSNDDCANAIAIAEDVGTTPAFVGSTAGATQDGSSPCYANIPGVTFKDVWFTYTPSQSGWVQVVATGTGSASPILSKWSACGGFVERCSGSGSFALVGGPRIAFEAVQGVPVVFSVAMRAGAVGPFRLNIDALGEPCALNTSSDLTPEGEACGESINDGCNTPGGGFGTIVPGQTIAGTLFNTTAPSVRDRDWFLLDVEQAVIATLSVRAQVSAEAVILGPPEQVGDCSGRQIVLARTPDFLNACTPVTRSVVLTPGQYFVAVAHLFGDGFACGSGYNNYLMSLTTQPCDQPQVLSSPSDAAAEVGGSVTFTGDLTSGEPVAYTWQWGQVFPGSNPPIIVWNDLFDGDFSDLFSTAQIVGSDTTTLTISGIDQVLADQSEPVFFRLKGETCAPNFTQAAQLVFAQPCPTCPADFDQDGGVTGADVEAFFLAFEAGEACGDTDQDGGVTGADVEAFFIAFEAGGC
jgi:hypothetical protein